MSPRSSLIILATLCAATARASEPVDEPAVAPAGVVEQYMESLGLKRLLATHLTQQLRAAEGSARLRIAKRLAELQVELFDAAQTADDQQRWETRTKELLALVPDAESAPLRASLAKARYRRAEAIAERAKLRLTTPEEKQSAETELRLLAQTFAEIGAAGARSVEALKRREDAAADQDVRAIRAQKDEAQRLLSTGMYFAGWSSLYVAMMSGQKAPAEDALVHFGWVLQAPAGRPATVDRLSETLLQYDHVARAALACALCESIRGRDDTALRWIDAVQSATDVPPEITPLIWPRRAMVLARASRWADLELLLSKRREVTGGRAGKPLPTLEARLVAILALEAMQDPKLKPDARPVAQSVADAAISDLISAGEIRHVTDLVARYGAMTLPGEGFLPSYVRGMQSYEKARAAHIALAGKGADEPVADAAIANVYRDAAAALAAAADSDQAARFPSERSNASLTAGLAMFFAGNLEGAATRLERAAAGGSLGPQAEDALWMAVVALDKATRSGRGELRDRLQKLSTLYLQSYPRTERAVNLLLSQAGSGAASDDQAVKILLDIDPRMPVYEQARRQAAHLLYNGFARARGPGREFAATRFLGVADEALRIERRLASTATDAARPKAQADLVKRLLQILDASLSTETPDADRAAAAIETLDALTRDPNATARSIEGEIEFRRLQLALAQGNSEQARRAEDRLRGIGGPFAQRANRLLYNRAVAALSLPNPAEAQLRAIVRHGSRIIEESADPSATGDAQIIGVLSSVADAASRLAPADPSMRGIAIDIDRKLVALPAPPAAALRRLARNSEDAGDGPTALDCWRRLLAAADQRTPEWLEARYETIRLLATSDPARAREALDQLRVLRPDFGAEPWGSRLRELNERLPLPRKEPAP